MKKYAIATFAGAFLPGILGAVSGLAFMAIAALWMLDQTEKYELQKKEENESW